MPEARTGAASVAAVMVNFRTPDLALDAARALASARAEFPDLRLVIADGFSQDDSVERLEAGVAGSDLAEWVTVLPLAVNGGFGWANNQAMLRLMQSDSPPDYIYLLNPDTQVTPGAVTTDKVAGCPPIKLAAQAVVYTARAGGTGVDKVVYEVTSANGQVVTYQVSITIKEDAPASPHRGKDQKT